MPFLAAEIGSFRPEDVPTLEEVLHDKTLLDPYIAVFRTHFVSPLTTAENSKRRRLVFDNLNW